MTANRLRKSPSRFKFRQPPRYAQYLHAVDELNHYAHEHYGKEIIHLAVRWLLDQPGVGVALWGARHAEQLTPIEEMTNWALSPHDMWTFNRILRRTIADPVGPEFMAPGTREAAKVV